MKGAKLTGKRRLLNKDQKVGSSWHHPLWVLAPILTMEMYSVLHTLFSSYDAISSISIIL